MKIKRVLIVGGTHGNELVGIYLIKKFEQCPQHINRSSFETLTLLGNPQAIAKCVRYIDKDLNRCFDFQDSERDRERNCYEVRLAQQINDQFGPSGQTPVDLIIDQHCSTANVGLMLILDDINLFTLNLSAYLTSIQPTLKIYSSATSGRSQDSLRSIAKYRIGIEVGSLPHGTLNADLLQKTKSLVHGILNYVEHHNNSTAMSENKFPNLYEYIESIDYPRDKEGEIGAMIHPQRQSQDYQALNPGDPIFLTFNGEVIPYEGSSSVYPIFINEAAYYEKGIAMHFTKRKHPDI